MFWLFRYRRRWRQPCCTLAGALTAAFAWCTHGTQPAAGLQPDGDAAVSAVEAPVWLARSNAHVQVLLEAMARSNPETARDLGIETLDREIIDLEPGYVERSVKRLESAVEELTGRLQHETHPLVQQDLRIAIEAGRRAMEASRFARERLLPHFDVGGTIYRGVVSLLNDAVPPSRRQAAVVRLQRYAGLDDGYIPLAILAKERVEERLGKPDLMYPPKGLLETDLANAPVYMQHVGMLFTHYKLGGWNEAYVQLMDQLMLYESFIRGQVLPKTRTEFRQPADVYEHGLRQYGVETPADELIARSRRLFSETVKELAAVAKRVARERKLSSADYREVIRELKKERLGPDEIVPVYRKRVEELDSILRRERIVTVPERDVSIRLARTEEERINVVAPTMYPPWQSGAVTDAGELLLPVVPREGGDSDFPGDFSCKAASWTLAAHEVRPGHELQFAAIGHRGVSLARSLFAMNTVNLEGWALYAEWEMTPHLPAEGQLFALQHRLLRAARAFLDAELNLGRISRADALKILREDVVLSEAAAEREVEYYTYNAPGHGPTEFYALIALQSLRNDVEEKLPERFDRRAFHDFVVTQGLLPPKLLRRVAEDEFVSPQRAPKRSE